ncbi:MAG: hypothetical protein ACYDBQ_04045 [Thermoplasmatota archaeon]
MKALWAALFLLPLSGCVSNACPGTVEVPATAPTWRVGDQWTFEGSCFGSCTPPKDTQTVVALEMHCGVHAYRIETTSGQTVWDRVGDHAEMETDDATGHVVSSPPCAPLPAPYYVGRNWTEVCHHEALGQGGPVEVAETRSYEVVARENITVPAGTFAVWKEALDATADAPGSAPLSGTMWWADGCAGLIQATRAGQTLQLVAYTC